MSKINQNVLKILKSEADVFTHKNSDEPSMTLAVDLSTRKESLENAGINFPENQMMVFKPSNENTIEYELFDKENFTSEYRTTNFQGLKGIEGFLAKVAERGDYHPASKLGMKNDNETVNTPKRGQGISNR